MVPHFVLVDEHGVVRVPKAKPEDLDAFVATSFPKTDVATSPPADGPGPSLRALRSADAKSSSARRFAALSALLWRDPEGPGWPEGETDPWWAIEVLRAQADAKDGRTWFEVGVAHRMRHDSGARTPDDFQAAVDAWARALALEPNQYIWRRHIQQYGPRMDKPYAFYDWIEAARAEIAARGEQPVALRVALTEAEQARPAEPGALEAEASEPDPDARIERAPEGSIAVDTAVAPDTQGRDVIRLHVLVRVPADGHLTLDREAGPSTLWVAGRRVSPAATSALDGPGVLRFEVDVPASSVAEHLAGYVLLYGCLAAEGTCRYLRHDFSVGAR
ncbi:MAG: hypothetical protein AB7T63_10540 [Planctomycetota bacterium]